MPKWLHDRAYHLMAKNPEMKKEHAFAIATQQAHATGHTPKDYGTPKGKRVAKAKFDKPKKEYTQTADPRAVGKKLEKRMEKEGSDVFTSYEMVKLGSFSEEMQKIAFGKAVKDVLYHGLGRPELPRLLREAKGVKEKARVIGPTALIGGVGTAGVGAGAYAGVKSHRKKEKKRLGRAYVLGARDMYGTLLSRARQRQQALRAMHRRSQSGK